jgi:hypothetical protein
MPSNAFHGYGGVNARRPRFRRAPWAAAPPIVILAWFRTIHYRRTISKLGR